MFSFIFSVFRNVVKHSLTYLIYYLKFNSLMEQVKRMAAKFMTEATTRSDILYRFGQEHSIFIREKSA